MYAFVDRPVSSLAAGGRFALWAMRGWIQVATRGGCPPGQLAPAFARHNALPALPPLHRLLGQLNSDAKRDIAFAPLGHGLITEDEAVLLQLWRDAADAPPRAHATLALLLDEAAVGSAFTALLSASARLGEAGLGDISADRAPASRRG